MEKYDLIVIGSGPAGQRAAIQAAKFGKRAALVEKLEVVAESPPIPARFPAKPSAKPFSIFRGINTKAFTA